MLVPQPRGHHNELRPWDNRQQQPHSTLLAVRAPHTGCTFCPGSTSLSKISSLGCFCPLKGPTSQPVPSQALPSHQVQHVPFLHLATHDDRSPPSPVVPSLL